MFLQQCAAFGNGAQSGIEVGTGELGFADSPLLLFYEISILVGSWIEKKREEEEKKAEESAGS